MDRCQALVASDPHKRAQWNTRDVNCQEFRICIRRPNRAMISAAAKHVGKPKPDKKTKPWSTPALRDAVKLRNCLRRTVQSNPEDYLAACGEVSRLLGKARRTKWEEFLADLEGNPDPARSWNPIKSLLGSNPLPQPSANL